MVDRTVALREETTAARDELMAAIESLADEDWDGPTANPGWTARDVLIHLVVSEPGNLTRMTRILEGRGELPPDWDLNRYNNRQVEKQRGASVGDLVGRLRKSRAELLVFLDGLSEDQLDVRGWHASGRELSLAEIFRVMANHERGHAADIRSASPPRVSG